jgi:hypothetical protein
MHEQVKRWIGVVGLSPSEVRSERDLAGLFQLFRPDGDGVDAIFEGLPGGPAILERLMRCYAGTSGSYKESDAFFIPRISSCTEEQALALVQRHMLSMKQLADAVQYAELSSILQSASPTVVATRDELHASEGTDDSPEVWLHDLVTDYMAALKPIESDTFLLREAFYSIANDQYLQYFFLWPLYEAKASLRDPFAPYFELWVSGVSLRFPQEDALLIHLV